MVATLDFPQLLRGAALRVTRPRVAVPVCDSLHALTAGRS
ncbi:hypothetical protein Pen02_76040 [Plantactinospora endophytica]|uniref:Uncharacterized protein n=1 Tax=Plantactinospora endophytica TaxID=673535 RepID=A0ABQ4ED71_9ACTN|nr:hypothetical protein Pen02_76040 [Plantactinospora endophytica]